MVANDMGREDALRILDRQDDATLALLAGELLAAEAAGQPSDDSLEAWRDVLGPASTAPGIRLASAYATVPDRADRDAVLADARTRADVARKLSISPQAVSARHARGDLVAVQVGRELAFPVWQLDPDAPSGVLAGVSQLTDRYPGGVISLSLWMVTPSADLGGITPRAALRAGRLADVLLATDALTSAAW